MRDKQIKSVFSYFANRQLDFALRLGAVVGHAGMVGGGGRHNKERGGKLSGRNTWECCSCLCLMEMKIHAYYVYAVWRVPIAKRFLRFLNIFFQAQKT